MTTYFIILFTITIILIIIIASSNEKKVGGIKDISSISAPDAQAEEIVKDYFSILSLGQEETAFKTSLLKNTNKEIRQAIMVYLSILENQNLLTSEILKGLMISYGCLDQFVDDNQADIVNRVSFELKTIGKVVFEEEKTYRYYVISSLFAMPTKMTEFVRI